MNHERYLEKRLFRRDIDIQFGDAFMDTIIGPACENAKGRGAHGDVTMKGEQSTKFARAVYEFNANREENSISVRSTMYQHDSDPLSAKAAQRLYDDIKQFGKREDIAFYPPAVVEESLEFFIRYSLEAAVAERTLKLKTSIGYAVCGVEVDYATHFGPNELDDTFEKTYDEQEILEVLRALIALELISSPEVETFLKQF